MPQEIDLKMNDQHIENHQAYIQNWISVLENDPDELFNSIKDAQKISDYLVEKGDIVKIKELDHANLLKMEEEKPKSFAEILKICTKEQIEQQRISFEGAKLILEYQKEQFHLDGDEEYLAITIKGINQMQEKLSMIAEIQGIQPRESNDFEIR